MLSNEYSLAKIGFDAEENEPLKVWRKILFNIHSPPQMAWEVAGEVAEMMAEMTPPLTPGLS